MLPIAPARLRGRASTILLTAVVSACAVPAMASAAVIEDDRETGGGALLYRANEETNTVTVRDLVGGGIEVTDLRGLTSRTSLCQADSSTKVRCAIGTSQLVLQLGDRSDKATIATGLPVIVEGGLGDDSFFAGTGAAASRARYVGGSGFDKISYANADRGVQIRNDGVHNDGRTGLDRDSVLIDVEQLGGSRFDDSIADISTSFGNKEIIGGPGNDVLSGAPSGGFTTFDMAPFRDGADTVNPGSGISIVDYSKRSRPINVTVGFGPGDDGETGEGDNIGTFGIADGAFVSVDGGEAGDTLSTALGPIRSYSLHGNGGDDRLEGGESGENLNGGPGLDTFLAGGGADNVSANDGIGEIVGCGTGIDLAALDTRDGFSSCENRNVGVLRLAPKTLRAEVDETMRMRLSWRHPRAWRRLRTIAMRLTQDGQPVGELTIQPRSERIEAAGAVRVVRRATRLTRRGATVTARLALRLDPSLTGRTLHADVEATDRRGARQLERAAATIRVSR